MLTRLQMAASPAGPKRRIGGGILYRQRQAGRRLDDRDQGAG